MMRRALGLVIVCCLSLLASAQERKTSGIYFRISGKVINGNSEQPLPGAHVTINEVQSGAGQAAVTGSDGTFAFDKVRAGKYQLSVERRGFATQFYQQHEDRFSTAIVVGTGQEATNLVVRALPDASFSGHITDEQGEVVRNARVMLIREHTAEGTRRKAIVANTSSDDQGRYHFAHLKPGAYYIAVVARPWYSDGPFMEGMGVGGGGGGTGYVAGGGRLMSSGGAVNPALDVVYPITFYPDVTDSSAARAIALQAGDRAAADIVLRAVPAAHVRIRSIPQREEIQDGPRPFMNTAAPAQIIFDDIEVPVMATMRGGGSGTMVMSVPPGRYVLSVASGARRFPRVEGQGDEGEQPPAARVREVEVAGDTELDLEELPASVVVSGTIKTAGGQPLGKPAVIELRGRAMRRNFGARAASNGDFTFPRGVPAGSYEIAIDGGEGVFLQSVSASSGKVTGRTVLIGGSEVRLTLVAATGIGHVEGVALRDSQPQSGVMILLVPNNPAHNQPLFRRDQSDSDGSFTLSDVVPGKYTLLALENGWDLSWSDAAVLKPLLANGQELVVERKGSYNVRVNVQ